MAALRSLLYAALFYPATTLGCWPAYSRACSADGRRWPWCSAGLDLNHWLAPNVLGIRTQVDGVIPPARYLIAVKHQSMFETTEMVRLTSCRSS